MNDDRFLKMKNQSSRTSLQPTPFVEILSFSLSLYLCMPGEILLVTRFVIFPHIVLLNIPFVWCKNTRIFPSPFQLNLLSFFFVCIIETDASTLLHCHSHIYHITPATAVGLSYPQPLAHNLWLSSTNNITCMALSRG